MADDPYGQKVFGKLRRQAIAAAEAMFDHPLKQYALFKKFEDRLEARHTPGIPARLEAHRQAKTYFGAIRLELGDAAIETMPSSEREQLIDLALEIQVIVRDAVAENSLSPQGSAAAIRQNLLPKLFQLTGLDHAKAVVEQVVQITRIELSRE